MNWSFIIRSRGAWKGEHRTYEFSEDPKSIQKLFLAHSAKVIGKLVAIPVRFLHRKTNSLNQDHLGNLYRALFRKY